MNRAPVIVLEELVNNGTLMLGEKLTLSAQITDDEDDISEIKLVC